MKNKLTKLKNNMENKLSLSVILPIKSALAKDFDSYFEKAINSLKNQQTEFEELILVPTQEETLLKFLTEYDFGNLNVRTLVWEQTPNFCSQVNFGIKNSNSKWISVFEFDDEYSQIWFKNVKMYEEYYPDVQVFLPVVVETDEKDVFAGFTNEATFAANFSQEMGYLTNDTLHEYQNFQTSGACFRKQVIEDFGGFKPSIKLTFVYELLLRMTYNSVSIMTIPRLGYKHSNLREGSIFWGYRYGDEKLVEDEVKFWLSTAKKEYFFVDDRAIKYEPQND